MPPPPLEFDDPHLKATLRRAAQGSGADPDLRTRMADVIAREPSGHRPLSIFRARRWLVAAALVLLTAALGGFLWHRHHLAEEAEEYLAANLPLFRQMIQAQASSATAATHPESDPLPLADRDALRKTLTSKLGRPIPVPDWRDKGWQLQSAAVTRVGPHPAAELRYEQGGKGEQGGRTILFVSLPAAAYTADEGEEPEPYHYTVDAHPIAGIVRDGGLHCMVGDKSVSEQDLAALKIP